MAKTKELKKSHRSWGNRESFSSVLEAVSRMIERLSFQRGKERRRNIHACTYVCVCGYCFLFFSAGACRVHESACDGMRGMRAVSRVIERLSFQRGLIIDSCDAESLGRLLTSVRIAWLVEMVRSGFSSRTVRRLSAPAAEMAAVVAFPAPAGKFPLGLAVSACTTSRHPQERERERR